MTKIALHICQSGRAFGAYVPSSLLLQVPIRVRTVAVVSGISVQVEDLPASFQIVVDHGLVVLDHVTTLKADEEDDLLGVLQVVGLISFVL